MAYSGPLQRHRGAIVINRTAAGRAVQQRCRAKAVQALLPDFGLMDGGCLALAKAVRYVLGRSRCAIHFVVADGMPQHAVARVLTPAGPVYIDADGIGTEADVLAKMAALEYLPGRLSLAILTEAEARRHGITDPDRLSLRLAPLLAATLTASFA